MISANRGRHARIGLLALAAWLVIAPESRAAPPAGSRSTREIVYFGPAGPVRIRLHVSLDGRAVDAAWNDAIHGLFALRDRDADGTLDPLERAPFGPDRGAANRPMLVGGPVTVQPLRLTFGPKDDKIGRAAFGEAFKTAGKDAIALRVVPARPDSAALSASLFRNIDRDGDGRLSAEELRNARDRLSFLDSDEDEYLTAAELLGRGGAANVGRFRPVLPGSRPEAEPAEPSSELILLTAAGDRAVKQLLAARGGPRATAIKRAEFGGDAKAFAALDQDGNGLLDTTELAAWLAQTPAWEIAIAFDSNGNRLTALAPVSQSVEADGSITAALPGGRFRFNPPAALATKEWAKTADAIRDRFDELIKQKGPIERKQLENDVPAGSFFDLADRNGDGKVDSAEVAGARKALAPLAACRVDIEFADQDTGLFQLLDRNGDDRLSPREMVAGPSAVKPFAAADGSIGPKDLMRRFQVRCAVEPIPVGVLVGPASPVSTDDRAPRSPVPGWFAKMDRNGDGDVSLREFLGPINVFRKLDRDGDGLISQGEAATK